MYCRNCGSEVTTGVYCSNCGTYVGDNAPTVVVAEPLSDIQRLKRAFSSKLFLAMAILASVSIGIAAVGAFFGFSSLGVMLNTVPEEIPGVVHWIMKVIAVVFIPTFAFGILGVVSYWMTYTRNKKAEKLNASGPKMIYILNKISVVIIWVFAVIFVVIGIAAVIIAMVSGSVNIDFGFEERIIIGVFGFVFGLVGVVYVVILLMYYRKLVKLFKQIAMSTESGIWNIDNAKAVYIWTLVLGMISAVSGLTGGGLTLISAASNICLAFWVKENFVSNA